MLIAGPTASGKTALAIKTANERDGIILNADSMQVYDDLRLLTARPTEEEEAQAPHRLFGHVSGHGDYSVGSWLRDIKTELEVIRDAGKTPIIVGGTGLYFSSLLEGLSEIPSVEPEIVSQLKEQWDEDPDKVRQDLCQLDPQMAERLTPSDRQRTIRALAVLKASGRSILYWQARKGAPLLDGSSCEKLILTPDREWLYNRIDRRFEMMMAGGAIEEVETLAKKNYALDRPVMKAIGVSQIMSHLTGALTLDETIRLSQTASRQYAKRQMTWFRNQMGADWKRITVLKKQ